MSYEERNTWVALIANGAIVCWFGWRVWTLYGAGALDGADGIAVWARTVLWMIPVSIVVTIILSILANVVAGMFEPDADPKFVTDERDRRFTMRGLVATMVVASAGMVGGLVLLALGGSVLVALNLMLFAFSLGALLDDALRIFFYRRGY